MDAKVYQPLQPSTPKRTRGDINVYILLLDLALPREYFASHLPIRIPTPIFTPSTTRHIMASTGGKTYIVEHLDEELGPWSELEYIAIATECQDVGSKFLLSSLPPAFKVPGPLSAIPAFTAETRGVEEIYAQDKSRVCLLDPAAAKDLAPEDGDNFDVFLFGGILGMSIREPTLKAGQKLTTI